MRLPTLLALLLFTDAAAAGEAFWSAARADGTHILMRHARAPGTGDPDGFRIGDCATQRNLDETGREQARRIGAAIRDAEVEVTAVLTSAWCRAADTAELLGLGDPQVEPALNSFFEDRSEGPAATAALKERLAALDAGKAVLVTHQVNITALTGVFPASGELVAVSVDPATGEVAVRGRLALQ